MNAQERTEYIDKFLLEELSDSEKDVFLNLMEKDSEFRKEVETQRLIIEALKMEVEQGNLLVEMNEFHADMEAERMDDKKVKPLKGSGNFFLSSSPLWLIAASLFLILGLSLFFILNDSPDLAAPSLKPWAQHTIPALAIDPSLGFAGEGDNPNITLQFISHPDYNQYFEEKGDTLVLYLKEQSIFQENLILRENREAQVYELTIDSISFILPKGLNGIIPFQNP